jgi:hypothetical protein
MDFITASHNYGKELIQQIHPTLWTEITDSIEAITDNDLEIQFQKTAKAKGPAAAINQLIKRELVKRDWECEPAIFNNPEYKQGTRWRLDFAKTDGKEVGVAVEVAFNHAEAIAWNLLKPVLSSQLNHVKKEFQTDMGVIIMATDEFRKAGGFDGATGTFEKFQRYLAPLSSILTVPLVLIGLNRPKSILFMHDKVGARKIGKIVRVAGNAR